MQLHNNSFLIGHFSLLEALLGHQAAVVRSRTCSMVGNMMKYSNVFYDVLQTRASLTNELIECLKDEDINVRKVGKFLIHNYYYKAIYFHEFTQFSFKQKRDMANYKMMCSHFTLHVSAFQCLKRFNYCDCADG